MPTDPPLERHRVRHRLGRRSNGDVAFIDDQLSQCRPERGSTNGTLTRGEHAEADRIAMILSAPIPADCRV
jgi:hypothetical protein